MAKTSMWRVFRLQIYKTSRGVICPWRLKERVFYSGNRFKPSIIFLGKATQLSVHLALKANTFLGHSIANHFYRATVIHVELNKLGGS